MEKKYQHLKSKTCIMKILKKIVSKMIPNTRSKDSVCITRKLQNNIVRIHLCRKMLNVKPCEMYMGQFISH